SLVEADETYAGGRRKGKRGRPAAGDLKKVPVVGVVQRSTPEKKGRVIARVAKDVKKETLQGFVREYVLPESTVFTDEFEGYGNLALVRDENKKELHYRHRRVNHSEGVYVIGDIHTNTIEGFWSLVKRGIGGVYHAVSQKYLQSYLNEYSFRYNRRDKGNLIFNEILKKVSERASERPAPQSAESLLL